jgi:hypothetical protein
MPALETFPFIHCHHTYGPYARDGFANEESEIMAANSKLIVYFGPPFQRLEFDFLLTSSLRFFVFCLKTRNSGYYTLKTKTAQAQTFSKVQRKYHRYCNSGTKMV